MNGFLDLGLAAGLAEAAAAAGYDEPTPLQRAAIPVLRRGGNAVLVASSGSGVTSAWGLALLDRLGGTAAGVGESSGGRAGGGPLRPRALVLTVTEERAASVARSLVRLAGSSAVPVRALTVDWSLHGGEGILVAPLGAAARAIGDSSLKLDALETIVFEQLTLLMGLEGSSVFEALSAALPSEAQRVVVTAEWRKDVERFVESHARRALTIPPRQADPALAIAPEPAGKLSYYVVPAAEKTDALSRVLRRPRAVVPLVIVRSTSRARAVLDDLIARGFVAAAAAGAGVEAVVVPASRAPSGAIIACDVPFDAATLATMDLEDGLVIVEPSELAHLRSIAAESGVKLEAVGTRPQRGGATTFREQVRRAIEEQDLDAQIALLDPLFAAYSPVEVAAALSALLRARPVEPVEAEAERRPERPQAFVRLFVSAGSRDGIRPGDLVGAIAGETGVSGDLVGKIDLRDTFSVVEVESSIADRVIRALNGTTLRGRSLRVDYDRRGAASASPGRPPRSGHRSHRS